MKWLISIIVLTGSLFAQTVNTDILPASTGLNLGHTNQRWNGFFQNLDIAGSCTFNGQSCLTTTSTINLTAPGPIGTVTPNIGAFTGLNFNGVYSLTYFGAKCDGVTDDKAAFTAALALIANGGVIMIPPSTAGCLLGSSLTINSNDIVLQGVGWDYGAAQAVSTLVFPAGVNGIISGGNALKIQDVAIVSRDVGANADVCLRMTGGRPFLERVLCQNWGSHGFHWDSSTGGNTDHWYAASLRSLSNRGDGFRFTGGSDENVGTCIDCDATSNTGVGFDLVSGANTNTFITPHASQNTGGDYTIVAGSSNYFFNAYCESGTGATFTIGVAANFNRVLMPNFGSCTPANSGGQSNDIFYTFSSSQGTTQLYLNPPNAQVNGHTYELSSGIFNPRDFAIRDVTGATDLLDYNSIFGLWAVVNKPWYFANFAGATSGGGTNSNAAGWYASCWSGTQTQTDLFKTQLLGGTGTSGTETLAFTHIPGCGVVGQYSFDGPLTATDLTANTHNTTTNCANGASPAVCASAAAGAVAVPTGVNPTLQINTTAVTANSRIVLTIDESLTIAATTCNTTLATLIQPVVTARSAGVSFTIQIGATLATNPACVSYMIFN